MANNRTWRQHIVQWSPDTASLVLQHPDGREVTHRFSPRIIETVRTINWHPNGNYAAGVNEGAMTFLHWVALDLAGGRGRTQHVDHVNGNTYDSRDSNVELVSVRENNRRLSKHSPWGFCVFKSPLWETYQVRVQIGGSKIFCPGFPTVEQAQKCAAAFTSIALEVDEGTRDVPSRNELNLLANGFR